MKNRFVRSATVEGMADSKGSPSPALFKLYKRLAKGGVGGIITGMTIISKDGRSYFPGVLGIERDDQIPEYRNLVTKVYENDCKIAMQIAHSGRQTTLPKRITSKAQR